MQLTGKEKEKKKGGCKQVYQDFTLPVLLPAFQPVLAHGPNSCLT